MCGAAVVRHAVSYTMPQVGEEADPVRVVEHASDIFSVASSPGMLGSPTAARRRRSATELSSSRDAKQDSPDAAVPAHGAGVDVLPDVPEDGAGAEGDDVGRVSGVESDRPTVDVGASSAGGGDSGDERPVAPPPLPGPNPLNGESDPVAPST